MFPVPTSPLVWTGFEPASHLPPGCGALCLKKMHHSTLSWVMMHYADLYLVYVHPPALYHFFLNRLVGLVWDGGYPSCLQGRGEVDPGHVTSSPQGQHIYRQTNILLVTLEFPRLDLMQKNHVRA